MVQGLPVIALNWGGPSLLVTPQTGLLIEPVSEEHVVSELAKAMDLLAADGTLAEQMSIAKPQTRVGLRFLWSDVISELGRRCQVRVREARDKETHFARV